MRKLLLFISLFLFAFRANAQTRNVLLEEYTGAYCGSCPLGGYYIDSMLSVYPNLLAVSLHAYGVQDAMDFPQIDTLYNVYSAGSPLAAIDRICPGGSSNNTAQYLTVWDANIQQRLSVTPSLTVNLTSTWNNMTRNISAQVDVNILSNMSAGDYRINLYVVEDSVIGTGPGYDQDNFYDTQSGSPFFGLGDPIIGYVHRHVARAILPSSWGLTGIISASPTTGQNFTTTFNYILPAGINENHVHLIAFVYSFTANHMTDEVLNVGDVKLIPSPSGITSQVSGNNEMHLYPSPANNYFTISSENEMINSEIKLYNSCGEEILKTNIPDHSTSARIDVSELSNGIYFVVITDDDRNVWSEKIMVTK
jgi:hypothetical protein